MKKIAIISPAAIGDIISISPLLRKLKRVYPNSRVNLYSYDGGFIENTKIDLLDEIITYGRITKIPLLFKQKLDILIGWGGLTRPLGYPKNFFYSLLITSLRAEKKIFYKSTEFPALRHINVCRLKLDILKKIDININESDYEPFIPFSFVEESYNIKIFLKNSVFHENTPKVVFHIGANKGVYSRMWSEKKWAEVVKFLVKQYKANVFFIGSYVDVDKTEKVIKLLDVPVINVVNKFTIPQTTALINEADLFISTNSGPMWIANALRVPQVVLCGPSKECWYPYIDGNRKIGIVRKKIDRKFCNPPCDDKQCRYGDNLCMKKIRVTDVIEAIKQLSALKSN